MVEQVVLGQSMDVLLGPLLREVGHPVAIPSHLSADDIPEGELWIDRIHHRVLVLDYLQCHLQLHSHQLLLDTRNQSGCQGHVLESTGRMVSNTYHLLLVQDSNTDTSSGSSMLRSTL